MIEPIPERVAQLATMTIHKRKHSSFAKGHCALEVAAWLAGEDHTDTPSCVSNVIAEIVRMWNDRIPETKKRTKLLRDLTPLMVGTWRSDFGDPLEEARAAMALRWLVTECAPMLLDQIDELKVAAEKLRAMENVDEAIEVLLSTLGHVEKVSRSASSIMDAIASGAPESSELPLVALCYRAYRDLWSVLVLTTSVCEGIEMDASTRDPAIEFDKRPWQASCVRSAIGYIAHFIVIELADDLEGPSRLPVRQLHESGRDLIRRMCNLREAS